MAINLIPYKEYLDRFVGNGSSKQSLLVQNRQKVYTIIENLNNFDPIYEEELAVYERMIDSINSIDPSGTVRSEILDTIISYIKPSAGGSGGGTGTGTGYPETYYAYVYDGTANSINKTALPHQPVTRITDFTINGTSYIDDVAISSTSINYENIVSVIGEEDMIDSKIVVSYEYG